MEFPIHRTSQMRCVEFIFHPHSQMVSKTCPAGLTGVVHLSPPLSSLHSLPTSWRKGDPLPAPCIELSQDPDVPLTNSSALNLTPPASSPTSSKSSNTLACEKPYITFFT